MISQELYLAERIMSQANAIGRRHLSQAGPRRGLSPQVRRFLGWSSLRLVALGARLVHYGLPPLRSFERQVGV
jgi:hypothetical protein